MQTAESSRIRGAQHVKDLFVGESLPQVKGDTLVQETEGISHRAVGSPGNIAECLWLSFDVLFFHEICKMSLDGLHGDPAEIILLTAGEDRDGNPVCLCRCQNKNHIGRGFLQRFKQGIEGT